MGIFILNFMDRYSLVNIYEILMFFFTSSFFIFVFLIYVHQISFTNRKLDHCDSTRMWRSALHLLSQSLHLHLLSWNTIDEYKYLVPSSRLSLLSIIIMRIEFFSSDSFPKPQHFFSCVTDYHFTLHYSMSMQDLLLH